MHYLPVSDAATRQAIDAAAIHAEWMRAAAQARRLAGAMYFKREGGYEYLVKTLPDKRQQRIGRRSPETEASCRAFTEAKQQAEARKRALETIVSVTGRMAVMRTIAPTVFVAFKRWMAELEARPPGKRRRDKLQADIVQQMLDEQLLIS